MDRRRVLSWKSWTRNGNNNIKVQELDDMPLQGTFYACNLQKVHVAIRDKRINCLSSGKGTLANITVGLIKI